MSTVCRTVLILLAATSVARGGLIITLVPEPFPPYPTVDPIRVEVFAQLDANSPPSVLVRGLQFNVSSSSPELDISTPITHDFNVFHDDNRFWDFSSTFACSLDPGSCGELYFTDGSLQDDDNLSIAFYSPGQSSSLQMKLLRSVPTRVGLLDVAIPQFGVFDLDVLNADEPNFLDNGSWFAFGFGVSDSDPAITWSAHEGSITGGHLRFVIPEPATLGLLALGAAIVVKRTTSKVRTN